MLPPAPPGSMIAPPAEVAVEIHDQQRAEIGRLLASGRKIEAIKRYREATGLGLKEAKDAVDYWEARGEITDRGGEDHWPQLPSGPFR
ncbi:MAG: ribosomal protein L7/L12 [Propionibacteriaceae bacterium]|nr:ribosomal protein L7/L12 [Propionibacteriaceae bacterium]